MPASDSVLEATPTLREALLTEAKHRLQDWLLCCVTLARECHGALAVAAQVPQQRLEAASPAGWSAARCVLLDAPLYRQRRMKSLAGAAPAFLKRCCGICLQG